MQFTFHSKGHPGQVRVTVAAVVEQGEAKFGVSRCSTKDQFVRKIGRERALERAVQKPLFKFRVPTTHEHIKWFVENAKFIAEQVKLNPAMV